MQVQHESRLADPPTEEMSREAILEAAQGLFAEQGYAGTTMKSIAGEAGCSVGYLYKHFKGKQDILHAISLCHIGVYDAIRRHVRRFQGLSGLDALHRELQMLCTHLVQHRDLLPVFIQNPNPDQEEKHARWAAYRQEDIALLEAARQAGELPDVDPADLAAVIDGAVWSLLKSPALAGSDAEFLRIPVLIDQLLFAPLRFRAAVYGKDTTTS